MILAMIPKNDPVHKAVKDFTGHTAEKQAVLRFLCLCAAVLCFAGAIVLLTGCTQNPRMVRPDGSYVDLGRTFLKKSTTETTQWTNGTECLSHTTAGADETVVPGKAIGSYTTLGIGKQLLNGLRTTESTKRVLAKEETVRAANKSAAANEALRIRKPAALPEAPAVTPAALPAAAVTGLSTP